MISLLKYSDARTIKKIKWGKKSLRKTKFDDDDTFDIQHIFMGNFLQKHNLRKNKYVKKKW